MFCIPAPFFPASRHTLREKEQCSADRRDVFPRYTLREKEMFAETPDAGDQSPLDD
ncbi:hypothetical protein [Roseiflexus castenholzii]|jgi:hypothetical protein|uniref:hypothetical protein n=1 Tax=Roseiflexus castenholzii TaxID=120962 RepID=UPI00030743B9|nr:hypothetical protein [Roseiflexus castenholzii]